MLDYTRSLRFFPKWDRTSPHQVVALMHLMSDAIKENPSASRLLEIGSYMGESATIFCGYPQFTRIDLVDGWKESTETLAARFKDFIKKGRVSVTNTASHLFAKDCGEYDFIYIDGGHDYKSVAQDIDLYRRKIADGGHMAGHDYLADQWPDVVRAVDEFVEEIGGNLRTYKDGSWLIRRTGEW